MFPTGHAWNNSPIEASADMILTRHRARVIGPSFDTRLLPAIVRGASTMIDRGESEDTADDTGLSESRSRLWLGAGDA